MLSIVASFWKCRGRVVEVAEHCRMLRGKMGLTCYGPICDALVSWNPHSPRPSPQWQRKSLITPSAGNLHSDAELSIQSLGGCQALTISSYQIQCHAAKQW